MRDQIYIIPFSQFRGNVIGWEVYDVGKPDCKVFSNTYPGLCTTEEVNRNFNPPCDNEEYVKSYPMMCDNEDFLKEEGIYGKTTSLNFYK
jgi:hypothetical protein